MGFKIELKTIKSSLTITKENMIIAFPVVKALLLESVESNRIKKIDIENASNFKELINEMRWELSFDKEGNSVSISNNGLNVAEEELLFTSICRFVENGSFVEYEREGENGNLKERFDYKNGEVINTTWVEDYDQNDKVYWKEI